MQNAALPPLDLLVPFEAAARLSSFTLAAAELHVTQSAVSQRVRTLEDHLGVSLFERAHRKITLTPQGRELLNGATVALQHLSAATQSVRRTESAHHLRVAADISIAAMWLPSRLNRFHGAHPEITIDLTASDNKAACLTADIAILHGDGTWPGFQATALVKDTIFPVCAPEYLERHPITSITDLLSADLIDLDYQHWNWMNWGIWLTETGLDPNAVRRVFQSNSYLAVIAAAKDGWGLALGWRSFLDDDLASGALVNPIPEQVTTPFGYFIALRDGAPEEARLFHDWIIAECGLA